MSTVVARQVTKAAVPLMLMVSANFFLQGHNLPGGGFIAGVMTAAALSLYYVIFDFEGVEDLRWGEGRFLSEEYSFFGVSGLLVAAASAVLAIWLGSALLDHSKGVVHLPILGSIHWTTATVFDLGVYLVVVGSLMSMVEVLGRE